MGGGGVRLPRIVRKAEHSVSDRKDAKHPIPDPKPPAETKPFNFLLPPIFQPYLTRESLFFNATSINAR